MSYRKNPQNSDTGKICCYHSKIWKRWLYHWVMHPKDADGNVSSVDPDQSLVWIYTVCPDLSVWKLRTVTVILFQVVNEVYEGESTLGLWWQNMACGEYSNFVLIYPSCSENDNCDRPLRKYLCIRSVISVNYHYITVSCPFNLLIRFKCYNTV